MNLDIPIKKIMTTDLESVSPNTPFYDIKNIFEQNAFHHIPVVDANQILVGIISKMDWLYNLKFIAEQTGGKVWTKKYYQGLKAKEIMTKNPVTLGSDAPIRLAVDILIENKYHSIPIVDEGKLIGIITSQDLITFAFYSPPVGA